MIPPIWWSCQLYFLQLKLLWKPARRRRRRKTTQQSLSQSFFCTYVCIKTPAIFPSGGFCNLYYMHCCIHPDGRPKGMCKGGGGKKCSSILCWKLLLFYAPKFVDWLSDCTPIAPRLHGWKNVCPLSLGTNSSLEYKTTTFAGKKTSGLFVHTKETIYTFVLGPHGDFIKWAHQCSQNTTLFLMHFASYRLCR